MKRIAGYLAILALSLAIGAGNVAAAPSFENSKCWFPVTSAAPARCGYLLVPEERGKSASRTLRLPVVIFKGGEPASGPKVEPIIILNGGPGGKFNFANKNSRAFWTQMAKTLQVPASRDVILFSQRGTDNARSKLSECPVFNDPALFLGASRTPGGETDMKVNFLKAFKECRAMLAKSGYPFQAYSTMASVADIGDLRSALGLSRLAVYGVSYGAKLAVELARHHPRGLTRLVLDSPLPAEGNTMFHQVENLVGAMRQLSVICKEIRTCLDGADMEKDLAFLLKKLGKRPREIRLNTNIFQRDSKIYYVKLDPTLLLDALFNSFYFQEVLSLVPEALEAAVDNDYRPISRLTSIGLFFNDGGINYTTNTTVHCQDVATAERVAALREDLVKYPAYSHYLETLTWAAETVCPIWMPGVRVHRDKNPRPVRIPALILSGGLDPVTPKSAAEETRKSFSGAAIIFDPRVTHGTLPKSECIREKVTGFLNGKTVKDAVC